MNPNKIREEAWDTIRDVIYTNVSDPAGRSDPKWIVATFPDPTGADFPGYPIIVISEPQLDWYYKTFHNEKRSSEVKFVISVFSRTNLEMSQLADAIDAALRDNPTTLKDNSLGQMKITDYPQQILRDGKQKVHYKQFFVRFSYYGD